MSPKFQKLSRPIPVVGGATVSLDCLSCESLLIHRVEGRVIEGCKNARASGVILDLIRLDIGKHFYTTSLNFFLGVCELPTKNSPRFPKYWVIEVDLSVPAMLCIPGQTTSSFQ